MVVLFVVLTIILFVTVDYFIQRRKKIGLAADVRPAYLSLSKVAHLIPTGVFTQPTFTWSKILDSGNLMLGVHPVLLGLIGEPDEIELLKQSQEVNKGDNLLKLHKGKKEISVKSPVKGTITSINQDLLKDPTWENLSQNWIYCVRPVNVAEEIKNWLIAERAKDWINEKYQQIKNFFIYVAPKTEMAEVGVVMADGGDLPIGILSQFDEKIWNDFERQIIAKIDK